MVRDGGAVGLESQFVRKQQHWLGHRRK
jgi:hypothetical protein